MIKANKGTAAEPLTMQDIIYEASVLFAKWNKLVADLEIPDEAVEQAKSELKDYLFQLERILESNGLRSDFNVELLTLCLTVFSNS